MIVHLEWCTNKQHICVHLYECTYAISYTTQLYIHLLSVYNDNLNTAPKLSVNFVPAGKLILCAARVEISPLIWNVHLA